MRLQIGDEITCIDNSETREGDDDEYEYALGEGYNYTILAINHKSKDVLIENDFSNREWYCFSMFDLDEYDLKPITRNLPDWF